MRILYVAYPLLPVSDASAGGAEQMLWTLEREMHRRGHETSVAACAGSHISGRLIVTGEYPRERDTFPLRNQQHHAAIRSLLQREDFDLVHDESGSFFANADRLKGPLLGTIHLPRHCYNDVLSHALGSQVTLNCVSQSQARTFADVASLVGWIPNGIAFDRFRLEEQKQDYLLWMGRICEEKAPHLAIEAARRAGRRLILAGQVYPFWYHEEYFAREIKPRLGEAVEFVEAPSFDRKLDLLSEAAALLVPSMVDETSSLVAMEAMACGTPVVAFCRGALSEIVAHRQTGFVVNDLDTMVAALKQLRAIAPADCRQHVERHFSGIRMAQDYANLYERLVGCRARGAA